VCLKNYLDKVSTASSGSSNLHECKALIPIVLFLIGLGDLLIRLLHSPELRTELDKIKDCDLRRCDQLATILDRSKLADIVNSKLKDDRRSLLTRYDVMSSSSSFVF